MSGIPSPYVPVTPTSHYPGPYSQRAPQTCPARLPRAIPTPLYGPELDGDNLSTFYERLRQRHGPVAPITLAPSVPAWLVIGYREMLRICRHERDFSHDPRHWNLLREGRLPADSPVLPMIGWRPALRYADGADHRRMRAAVTDTLRRIDLAGLTRTVKDTAEALTATLARGPEADLVPHYAQRLCTRVLTGLLGLDERTGQLVMEAAASLSAANADSANASGRLDGILIPWIEEKYRAPQPDLISWLIEHPAQLTAPEVLHNLLVITVTAYQTTKNWISTTLRILLTDPPFRSSLASGRLTLDEALDQVLWRCPPTQNLPICFATRDLRLGRTDIRAGDLLILGLAGANADPEALPRGGLPAAGNRAHFAFGAGPHACPAPGLARLITRTAVDTIQRRFPNMELAVPESALAWAKSPWTKALATLPVRLGRR